MMRNLMGRLNARTDEELQRIAVAWLIPATARDRAASIAQAMRAMLDLRAVRDFWFRRTHAERAMIALFVADGSDRGLTLDELTARLGGDATAVRATATRLYQAGVLAADQRPQAAVTGEPARLFLPRETSQMFARVIDEIDAGDISGSPLSALLELLDDPDIQRAAEVWQLEPVPGLRTRRELTEGLLELVSYPDRRAAVERKLGWDARRILGKVAEVPVGQPVPLAEVTEALDLDPDQPRSADRLRQALTELEESLLVWHTVTSDGARALFQPMWQRDAEAEDTEGRLPVPVEAEPERGEPQHPAALAWDLLTLLRWVGAGTPEVAPFSSVTGRSRQRLDELLWNRGRDEPVPGYLDFLAALADHEQLLDPPDADSRVNQALRRWRTRSFGDQMTALLYAWLAAPTWIEAMDQEDVVVSGAQWPQFRRRLLVLLPELDPERWYPLESVARWCGRLAAESLGESVRIATARPLDTSLDRSTERLSSLEQVVERTLLGPFAWFGLIERGVVPSTGEVIRVTHEALVAAGVRPAVVEPEPAGPPLVVHADGTVTIPAPSPLRIWATTAFADQVRLRPVAEYRITRRSLKGALAAGFRIEDVETFLERQSGAPLEPAVRSRLDEWAETLGRVWLTPSLILEPDQDDDLGSLRSLLEAEGLQVTPLGSRLLVEDADGSTPAAFALRLDALLRTAGRSPQFRRLPDSLEAAGDDLRGA